MKVKIVLICFLILNVLSIDARGQWTENQAWEWINRIGVIKGFNQPEAPYPSMSLDERMAVAKRIGLNNVRFWVGDGGDADTVISKIRRIVEAGERHGITSSPVLVAPVPKQYYFSKGHDTACLKVTEQFVKRVIGAFAEDKRVILWDLWNEPGNYAPSVEHIVLEFKLLQRITIWARSVDPVQALSSSIFWRDDVLDRNRDEASRWAWKVEAMMDVHNFHDYVCGDLPGGYTDKTLSALRQISNRPLICTECMTRVNNSGLDRTFAIFAPNNVHWYLWGLHMCDANWDVKWNRSTYDPYEPGFHNLLRPDGEPIDYRDIELIRNFAFTDGKAVDPGLELTGRWPIDRAWRWMSRGPVKGLVLSSESDIESVTAGFNSVTVKLSFDLYAHDKDAFYQSFESLLADADKRGLTVLPVLLTDEDVKVGGQKILPYIDDVINRYYYDGRIQGWDLWRHPGKLLSDSAATIKMVRSVFREARQQWPNQPVMMTPWVSVKDMPADFDYWKALVHGHGKRGGWAQLQYGGASSDELTWEIWRMSDCIAFSSSQDAKKTGWIKAVAYRYGRPIICTFFSTDSEKGDAEVLDNFSRSHVFWYAEKAPSSESLSSFHFAPITTKH